MFFIHLPISMYVGVIFPVCVIDIRYHAVILGFPGDPKYKSEVPWTPDLKHCELVVSYIFTFTQLKMVAGLV